MPKIAAAELLARLAKGKPIPALLLLGEEVFLRDACRSQLIEKFVPEDARVWAVSRFSADRGETQAALGQAQTLPMLSPRQVVFLEDAEAIEKLENNNRDSAVKAIEVYLENPAPFTTLVMEAAELDQRMRLAKLLTEKALIVTLGFGEKDEERRANAIAQARTLATDLGVTLESGAAEDLAESVADDLLRMQTELRKLATYVGERGHIRREDVAALVVSQEKNTVWQLANMIASRQRKTALAFLDRVLRDGEEPVAMVGAMAWMYRKLLEAQEVKGTPHKFQLAGQLHMNPDVAELALQCARRIPREQLVAGLRALHECDGQLRSSVKEPRALLDFLIVQLTGEKKSAA